MRGRYKDRQRRKGLNQAEVEAAASRREKITMPSPAVSQPVFLIPPQPRPCLLLLPMTF